MRIARDSRGLFCRRSRAGESRNTAEQMRLGSRSIEQSLLKLVFSLRISRTRELEHCKLPCPFYELLWRTFFNQACLSYSSRYPFSLSSDLFRAIVCAELVTARFTLLRIYSDEKSRTISRRNISSQLSLVHLA